MSDHWPVVCSEPWVMIEPIELSVMPRPTSVGPEPPMVPGTGAAAPRMTWAIMDSNATRWDL